MAVMHASLQKKHEKMMKEHLHQGTPLTLNGITQRARTGRPLSEEELRLAVCAYDVLFAQINADKFPGVLKEYFRAAEITPEVYIGWQNNPNNPEFVQWYLQNITIDF